MNRKLNKESHTKSASFFIESPFNFSHEENEEHHVGLYMFKSG